MRDRRSSAERARLEALEERRLLSTYLVDNGGNKSDGYFGEGSFSLREAVELANANPGEDTIRFASTLGVVTLTTDLTVTDDTRIEFIDESGSRHPVLLEGFSRSYSLIIDDGDDDHSLQVTIDGFRTYSNQGGRGVVPIRSRESMTILNARMSGYRNSRSRHIPGLTVTGTTPDAFLIVRDSFFDDCRASLNGQVAAVAVSGVQSVELTRCTITGCEDGALTIEDAESVQIINCTITDNFTSSGVAGVRLDLPGGNAVISNCTIASNNSRDPAYATAGGVQLEAGTLRINSTILAFNLVKGVSAEMTVALGAEMDLAGSRNNLVLDQDTAGWLTNGVNGNLLGVNPLLELVGDNGGQWQTRALREDSPALDAGNNDLALATDQRGMPYTRESGTADIGAYEAQSLDTVLVVDSTSDTDDGDYSEGQFTLREAIAWSNATPEIETIRFSAELEGATIVLADAVVFSRSAIIDGPGMDLLTLDGGGRSQMMEIGDLSYYESSSGLVTIGGLSFTNAVTALLVWDSLTLDGVRVTACGGDAAAIVNRNLLTITDSEIVANHNNGDGGAIYSSYSMTISGSTIRDNSATGDGGAIWASSTLLLSDSTLSGNTAAGSGGATWGSSRFTIEGCVFSMNVAGQDGGAAYAELWHYAAVPLEVTGTRFESNQASGDGGAVWGRGGFTGCTFADNTTGGEGGAIRGDRLDIAGSAFERNEADGGGAIWAEELEVSDSTFSQNHAGDGGAILVHETADIAESRFEGNTATGRGGAIACTEADGANNPPPVVAEIAACALIGNTAGTDGGALFSTADLSLTGATLSANEATRGGALFSDGTITISRSMFEQNAASASGGAIYQQASDDGTAYVETSLLAGNHADGDGGAIWTNGDFRASNCTLSGNSAGGSGGAVAVGAGATTLRFCTVAFNTALDRGAAVVIDDDAGGLLLTSSSLYTDNTVGGLPSTFADASGAGLDAGSDHNLLDSAQNAGGLANGQLGNLVGLPAGILPLADNGGPTQTHALEAGSAAIDGGGSPLPTDQRGASRLLDEGADIGAYERVLLIVRTDSQLTAGSDADGRHHIVGWGFEGDWVVFTGSAENWSAEYLDSGDDADPIGDAVTWIGAPDLGVIAGPTSAGLVLFSETAGGAWTSRNLSAELGVGDDSPVRALTTIRTRDGLMMVAGYNAADELVAFHEVLVDGAAVWTFINISDDLSAQGMTTPNLEALIGYATPWDAWNLAGIDANGDIQAVWVHPATFTEWRVDNLSAITGAAPLAGGLSVTQTAWKAINLGGLDSRGRLMVTWWVPGNPWTTSDLSSVSGAPELTAGQLTGFVTPWGAINYVGVDTSNRVVAIWWTKTTGWQTDPLLGAGHAPSGPLTGHSAADGSISVLGSTTSGEVVRLWWMPGEAWVLSNLSELAAG
jgi:predicted outer membrane repeat protein